MHMYTKFMQSHNYSKISISVFEILKSLLFSFSFFTLQLGLLDNEIVHLPRGHVVMPITLDENNSDKCVDLSQHFT